MSQLKPNLLQKSWRPSQGGCLQPRRKQPTTSSRYGVSAKEDHRDLGHILFQHVSYQILSNQIHSDSVREKGEPKRIEFREKPTSVPCPIEKYQKETVSFRTGPTVLPQLSAERSPRKASSKTERLESRLE